MRTATFFAGSVALALSFAACGDSGTSSEDPQSAAPGEELVSLAGYDYADSPADPTAAAVIDAYEAWDALPPAVTVSEDFESGAGPFQTFTDESGSVSVTGGALRITNSDPEYALDSYAEFDEDSDNVLVNSGFSITEPLQADEGPALVLSRWNGDEVEFAYEFSVDGQTASLWESTGPDPDDSRLLDSASVSAELTGQVDMGLWVFAHGETTGIVGFLGNEAIVAKDGASGPFDTVALRVWSTGTPRTIDFPWAQIRAQAADEDLPDLFADQSQYAVQQEGTQVATITVLEASQFLRDYPEFEDEQALPSVLEEAAPAGMTAGTETVAGASIVQGESDGTTFWVWTHEQDWYIVSSEDPAAGEAFVEAYVSAQHPPEA